MIFRKSLIGLFLWAPLAAAESNFYNAGFPTADVLHHGEMLLAPIPWGWVAYGATPQLTVAWDYPLAIVGYPAGLVRWQIPRETHDVHYAVEAYMVGFPKKLEDTRQDDYKVVHRGLQSWLRLNRTAELSDAWRWHLYAGANYKTDQRYEPAGTSAFPVKRYKENTNVDAGIGLEWRARDWVSLDLDYSYGNTLLLYDQIAIKSLVSGGLHLRPFRDPTDWAILRNMRIELLALTVHVPDAHYSHALAVPVYPYVFWQWRFKDFKDG